MEDIEFWTGLAQEERQHARDIERMALLISEKAELLHLNRPYWNILAMVAPLTALLSAHAQDARTLTTMDFNIVGVTLERRPGISGCSQGHCVGSNHRFCEQRPASGR